LAAALLLGIVCWVVVLGIIFAVLRCESDAEEEAAPEGLAAIDNT